jgi:predicted HTH transcriptional regulator
MNTAELDALLEGAAETPSLEFKRAMAWDYRSLTRDILAMSNVRDGGIIVFGVEDATFERQGLTEEQIATFNIDIMRDQVSPYADPYVTFQVSVPTDSAGRRYAVIEVAPFDEVPTICARGGQDVNYGDLYYRSNDRRPQSARVSSSHDMRNIIERAIVRRRNKLVQIGLVVDAPPAAEVLDAELGGL